MRIGNRNTMALNFPLRRDFMAQVVVPKDMTMVEAARLRAFLLSLATPATPTKEGE